MRSQILAVLILIFLASISAHADAFTMVGRRFSAPNVDGFDTIGNPQPGNLIFNAANSSFYGYGGSTPGWMALGATVFSQLRLFRFSMVPR